MDSTYVTAYQIFSNIYDIKIDFATIEPETDENGNITNEPRIVKNRITMPVVLAKEMAKALSGVVSEYEKQFGSIPELAQGSNE